jgi:enoyl-CoA hydratase/carnithine racemase
VDINELNVKVERRGGVGIVTMALAEKRNALTVGVRVGLMDAFRSLSDDDEIGCVVLTAEGDTFSSGLDRGELMTAGETRDGEMGPLSYEPIAACSKPVIAAVNGPSLAGGFALALHCDVRIAASSAQFGFLGHGKGIPPSYAAARSVLSPGTARDLCVTGRVVGAEDALKLGIVSEVTADADLMARTMEIAEGVAASPRPIVLEMKRRFLADQALGVDQLMREEETFLEQLIARVRKRMARASAD